jgi:predicted secreted hydrolase
VGWDWMGLRLDDGRDLMLYLLRRADGVAEFRSATLVDSLGRAHYLDPAQWSLHVLGTWKSPNTNAVYPDRWLVVVPEQGLRLEIVPEMADQENRSRLVSGLFYWEGAVRATAPLADGPGRPPGRIVGRGYVELTGYGKGSRVPR